MFFLCLLILMILIGIIILQYFVAKKFEVIAFQKGYNESVNAFAMCFWLGILGCLYVIALPDLKQHRQREVIITLLKKATGTETSNEELYRETQKATSPVSSQSGTPAFLYACDSFKIKEGTEHTGICMVCRRSNVTVEECKVKNATQTQTIVACKNCISKFKKDTSVKQ